MPRYDARVERPSTADQIATDAEKILCAYMRSPPTTIGLSTDLMKKMNRWYIAHLVKDIYATQGQCDLNKQYRDDCVELIRRVSDHSVFLVSAGGTVFYRCTVRGGEVSVAMVDSADARPKALGTVIPVRERPLSVVRTARFGGSVSHGLGRAVEHMVGKLAGSRVPADGKSVLWLHLLENVGDAQSLIGRTAQYYCTMSAVAAEFCFGQIGHSLYMVAQLPDSPCPEVRVIPYGHVVVTSERAISEEYREQLVKELDDKHCPGTISYFELQSEDVE